MLFVFTNTFLYLHSENMSDNDEEVLEDFSGMTQINGVTISPPEEHKENEPKTETEINEIEEKIPVNNDASNNTSNKNTNTPNALPMLFHQEQRPKFFDVLKSLGTTTLIVMGLVMLFLSFIGYKYVFG